MTAFEEFGVLPEIARSVDEMEWTLPTDVQAEAIPLILGGGDVLMAAGTGSGKTGAFCLPILQIVWETLRDLSEGKGKKGVASGTVPPWTMSYFDRGNALAVTPDGLRCQSREFKEWHGCRATTGVKGPGKYYYESIVTDEGQCRVGWSTEKAALDLGTCIFGFGFGGTGKKSNAKLFDDYGEAYGMQDAIGCLLDFDRCEIRFTKNGTDLGLAFRIPDKLKNETFYPAVVLKNAEMSFNFGASDFKYKPTVGFQAISKADLKNLKQNPNATSQDFVPKPNAPQAIIIEPTREVAEQTYNQIVKFKKHLCDPIVKELLLIGGVNVRDQLAILKNGADIIVATPGRLEDLIGGGQVSLTHCRFFVLDEADGLLKAGYENLINNLHKQIPKITSDGRRLQMIVCSATLHAFEVKKMAERLMHFPTWIDLKGEDSVPETVHHVVTMVNPMDDKSWHSMRRHIQTDGVHAKDNVKVGSNSPETYSEAIKMLKGEYCLRAIDEHKMDRAIIFCRTKLDCDNLEKYLKQINGREYSCVCLHGDRKPAERKSNLELFKDNKVKFLICTDVAARGLDISGLPYIINVTLPDEKSNYVHRIGRVGRAERMGLAISLVSTVPEKVWYHGQWCASRGKNCWNTNLTDVKGCCMWYNEMNYLQEIEDHLNVTIQQVDKDMKVPVNDFDGKVVYGEKLKNAGTGYADHVSQLVPIVQQLSELESQAQSSFLKRMRVYYSSTSKEVSTLIMARRASNNSLLGPLGSPMSYSDNISGLSYGDSITSVIETPVTLPGQSEQQGPRQEEEGKVNMCGAAKRRYKYLMAQGHPPGRATKILALKPLTKSVGPTGTNAPAAESKKRVRSQGTPEDSRPKKKSCETEGVSGAGTVGPSRGPQLSFRQPLQSVMVGILPTDYPNRNLSMEQLKSIQNAIIESVIAQKDQELRPNFLGVQLRVGYLAINCAGLETANWLRDIVPKINIWEGVGQRVVEECDMPRALIVVGVLPDSAERSTEEILGLIRAQNHSLSAELWKVIGRERLKSATQISFSLDHVSAEALKKTGFQVYYLFGVVQLRAKGGLYRSEKTSSAAKTEVGGGSGPIKTGQPGPSVGAAGKARSNPGAKQRNGAVGVAGTRNAGAAKGFSGSGPAICIKPTQTSQVSIPPVRRSLAGPTTAGGIQHQTLVPSKVSNRPYGNRRGKAKSGPKVQTSASSKLKSQ